MTSENLQRAGQFLTFLLFALLVCPKSALAQDRAPDTLRKAARAVLHMAEVAAPQLVTVELDADDILGKQVEKRRSRGLTHNDPIIIRETRDDLARLKRLVFPQGRIGDARIVHDDEYVPVVIVSVPNLASLTQLLAHPRVKFVHEIRSYVPALAQSLPLIGQPAAATANKQGAGTRIAILDTPFDVRGQAFSSTNTWPACRPPGADASWGGDPIGTGTCRISEAVNFTGVDPVTGADGCWTNACGSQAYHGENVAGIAASVAAKARISALQVFSPAGSSNSSIIQAAMNWVLANIGTGANKIVAINLSIDNAPGTTYASECAVHSFKPYFDQLRAAGVVPVVAAGNSGSATGVSDPACVPGAVRVGAVYDANVGTVSYSACSDSTTAADKVPCFSNSGPLITLLAPGAAITVDGTTVSGTSQAAPHVAGAVAVLRAPDAFPGDTVDGTTTRLTSSGTPVTDLKNNQTKPRIRLYSALTQPGPPAPPPVSGTLKGGVQAIQSMMSD